MNAEHATHLAAAPAVPQRCERCWQISFSATTHCLAGCAIGEVLGLALATVFGWHDVPAIALAVVLAYFFGYALAMRPLLRSGFSLGAAIGTAVATDTISITVMELLDNAIMLLIPGAMDAGLGDLLFWGSLAASLIVAFSVTWPVNYLLIRRGLGHAAIHKHHTMSS